MAELPPAARSVGLGAEICKVPPPYAESVGGGAVRFADMIGMAPAIRYGEGALSAAVACATSLVAENVSVGGGAVRLATPPAEDSVEGLDPTG